MNDATPDREPEPTARKLIPREEAAKRIGVCLRTFDKYRERLKPIQFGRRVFFSPDVLNAFIRGEGIATGDEQE
jgi:hypothetical protein